MTSEQKTLTEEIIEYELEMFMQVKNLGGTAFCQEHPKAFKLMRAMSHSVQSPAFLESYLNDLKQAKAAQRNFMVEKYALMDNLIPNISDDPRIDIIVNREAEWRDLTARLYPHIIGRENSAHFKKYLQSELQTLSSRSIACYYDTVMQAYREGKNLVSDRYTCLMKLLGYSSLEEREKQLAEAD